MTVFLPTFIKIGYVDDFRSLVVDVKTKR